MGDILKSILQGSSIISTGSVDNCFEPGRYFDVQAFDSRDPIAQDMTAVARDFANEAEKYASTQKEDGEKKEE